MSEENRAMTPSQIGERKQTNIPKEVFDAVNHLLSLKISSGRACLMQDDIIAEIQKRIPNLERQYIFNNSYLDFEDSYRQKGWKVVYDKPGYNESYSANFTFSVDK